MAAPHIGPPESSIRQHYYECMPSPRIVPRSCMLHSDPEPVLINLKNIVDTRPMLPLHMPTPGWFLADIRFLRGQPLTYLLLLMAVLEIDANTLSASLLLSDWEDSNLRPSTIESLPSIEKERLLDGLSELSTLVTKPPGLARLALGIVENL